MDIRSLVLAAIDNTIRNPEQGAKYFRRPAGSFVPWLREEGEGEGARTAGVLRELARDNCYIDVSEDVRKGGNGFGRCLYFRAPITGALEAACLLSELSDEALAEVRVVRGAHGFELQAPGVAARPTDHLHVCVGAPDPFAEPTVENVIVYFWAPGRVLPRFDAKSTTVKLG